MCSDNILIKFFQSQTFERQEIFIDDVSNTVTVDQRKIFGCEGLFHVFYHTGSSSFCLNIRSHSVVPTTTRCIHPKPRTDHLHFLLQEPR